MSGRPFLKVKGGWQCARPWVEGEALSGPALIIVVLGSSLLEQGCCFLLALLPRGLWVVPKVLSLSVFFWF